jgi:hypothetical protein
VAIANIKNNLPTGTMFEGHNQTYRYGVFSGLDKMFLVMNPEFDWLAYINNTLTRPLRSFIETRFLRIE